MSADLEADLFAAAQRTGVPPARLLRAALDTFAEVPAALTESLAEPRSARALAPQRAQRPNVERVAIEPPPEYCDSCHREIGGPANARCCCFDPVKPGASPLAFEAQYVHPAGVGVATELARAAFAPYELSLARNSVAQHRGTGVVFINGAIDGGSAFHVLRMIDAHRAVGAKAIVLDIRSEGGSVPAGLAMVRGLERLRKEHVPTVAVISRQADSMASVIAVSCGYALMTPGATMQIHEASGGDPAQLEILRAKLLDIYEARTLMSRDKLAGYLAGAVTLDAHAARSHGFVDEVAGPERAEEIARAVGETAGLFSSSIRAANSWRRHVLCERQADADGVVRYGPRQEGRGL